MDEELDYQALVLEAWKRLQKVLEKAHEARNVPEEEVHDGVLALGGAYMWMRKWDECQACFERAKEGFVCLLGRAAPRRSVRPLALRVRVDRLT